MEWNQIQADIYGRPVEKLKVTECTTLGAVILGAVGCGIFNSVEEGVREMVHPFDKVIPNKKNHNLYADQYELYKDVYTVLMKNRVYERIANFQKKYWG